MSLEMEQAIVGGLLTEQSALADIYNIIEPSMFRDPVLSRVFSAIRKAYDAGIEGDLPYYAQQVRSETAFPEDAVIGAMGDAIKASVTTATIKSDAIALAKEYMANEFKKLLNNTRPDAVNVNEQINELIDKLAKIKTGGESVNSTLSSITERYENDYFKPKEGKTINLGFADIDDILGGLEGGDIVMIGARPAVGKSALATQISKNLGNDGKTVYYFNLEMKEKQVYERFVVSESGIGLTRLRRATTFLNDEEQRFKAANAKLREKNNIVISTGSKSVTEIRTECKTISPDVVVVDYMQLIKPESNYRGNRYAEVGAISHALKALAMELNIPVIVLAQLNRQSMGRDSKEPTMAEFRESGDCEQDASQILLLWNTDENDESYKGCKIAKNRQGKTGRIDLRFDGDLMQFTECGGGVSSSGFTPVPKDAEEDLPFEVDE